MKADTILMLAGLGAVAVGGYLLIKPAADAVNNIGKGWEGLTNSIGSIGSGFNNWTSSFNETPEQTAARVITEPAAVVATMRNNAGMVNPLRFSSFISGTQGRQTTPNFPDVAQAIVSQQPGYVQLKQDNQISLGSSGSSSYFYTAPRVVSSHAPVAQSNPILVTAARQTLTTSSNLTSVQRANNTLMSEQVEGHCGNYGKTQEKGLEHD